jgi:hypothetical protein
MLVPSPGRMHPDEIAQLVRQTRAAAAFRLRQSRDASTERIDEVSVGVDLADDVTRLGPDRGPAAADGVLDGVGRQFIRRKYVARCPEGK